MGGRMSLIKKSPSSEGLFSRNSTKMELFVGYFSGDSFSKLFSVFRWVDKESQPSLSKAGVSRRAAKVERRANACGRISPIAFYCPQQGGNFFRLNKGGIMLPFNRLQSISQLGGNIPFSAPRRDGITEDLSAQAFNPMRGFSVSCLLNAAQQYAQQLARGDVPKGAMPQQWKHVAIEPAQAAGRMARNHFIPALTGHLQARMG